MKRSMGRDLITGYLVAWFVIGLPLASLPEPVQRVLPIGAAVAEATTPPAPPGALPPLPPVSGDIAGAIPGTFSVGLNGLPNYTIKIAVPPGTKDLAPDLALTFTGAKKGNILGPGWVLQGLSAISRCNAVPGIHGYARAVQLDDNDKVCLDGEALTTISGNHMQNGSEMRSLNEQMTQIFPKGNSGAGPTSFHAYRKDGTLFIYGSGTSSVKPPGQSAFSAWELVRIYDTSTAQNSVEFGYEPNPATGESVPKYINYTDQDSGWRQQSRVEFSYRARTVNQQAGIAGRFVTNTKLLDKISVFSDGVLAWEYQLSYFYYHLTFEDRLTEVKLCAGGVCLPSTKFRWGPTVSDNPDNSQPSARFEKMGEVNDLSYAHYQTGTLETHPILVGDWNGDGRTDFARYQAWSWPFFHEFVFYASSPNGFYRYWTQKVYSTKAVTGDWNGDGLTDFMTLGGGYGGSDALYVATGSAATGFSSDLHFRLPWQYDETPAPRASLVRGRPLSADLDGDGKGDLVVAVAADQFDRVIGFVNRGSDFQRFDSVSGLCGSMACTQQPLFFNLGAGDWNGDGLSDLVAIRPGGDGQFELHRVQSIGSGLVDSSFVVPTWLYSVYNAPHVIGDFSGDGLSDVIFSHVGVDRMFLGDGSAFAERPLPHLGLETNQRTVIGDFNGDGTSDIGVLQPSGFQSTLMKNGQPASIGFDLILSPLQGFTNTQYDGLWDQLEDRQPLFSGDWNGDGLTDIARVGSDRIYFYTRKKDLTHQLQEITDGYGASVKITYAPLTDTSIYTKGSGAVYPEVDLQPTTEVVTSVQRTTALGTLSTTRYTYSGFRHNLLSRQPVGFETVTSTQSGSGDSTTTFFGRAENNKGLPIRTEQRDSTGRLLERQEQSWQLRTHSGNRSSPLLIGSVSTSFALDGSVLRSSTTTSTYDGDLNETRREVVSSDGSIELTERQFRSDTNLPRLLERPLSVKVTRKVNAADPGITRHSVFTYQSGTGHLESETIEPDSTTERVTKRYE